MCSVKANLLSCDPQIKTKEIGNFLYLISKDNGVKAGSLITLESETITKYPPVRGTMSFCAYFLDRRSFVMIRMSEHKK